MQESSLEKPDWLKIRPPKTDKFQYVRNIINELGLNTICTSSKCPNYFECWDGGTVTFMILGNVCTRHCRFCSVIHGKRGEKVDPTEPERLAEAVKRLGLNYAVITSVSRDDLDDHGSQHYVDCIKTIRSSLPGVRIEVVIPDFGGRADLLLKVINAGPDVITHNLETVESLTPVIRDRRAGYYKSLDLLKNVKRFEPGIVTKSSVLLGLGENIEEIKETIKHLHESRVNILTMGQYLKPGKDCYPVQTYVSPDVFQSLKDFADSLDFSYVASGPFVRSSYRSAGYFFEEVLRKGIRGM
ncbi:lipoyl synthase [Methanocella sp. CWC-04]|uniref:Lipoyl synthase n=1 Tax=Methanooceanicella nereidis TaxID=2052831 RepID=A0AAP2RD14_9EURY|nr:lipoyl synthase [Methanocella sp. CWC-04]MCD1295188.1 lipoyl synthase [Methanocella sp. CWC-04]